MSLGIESPCEDGEVVCPKCLTPNPPETAFCVACGAPIGMVANIDPIQSIYAEGFGYRSAADGPPRRIIVLGIWLIFLPMAGLGLLGILQGEGMGYGQVLSLLFFLMSIGILTRVTRNYLVKSRAAREKEVEREEVER